MQGIWRMLAHLAGARVPARCFSSLIPFVMWSAKTTEHVSGIALASVLKSLRDSSRRIESEEVCQRMRASGDVQTL